MPLLGELWGTSSRSSITASLPSPLHSNFPLAALVHGGSVSALPPPGPGQVGHVFMGEVPDDGFGARDFGVL